MINPDTLDSTPVVVIVYIAPMKEFFTRFSAIIAYSSGVIFLFFALFTFQYNLLTGPFINALLLAAAVIVGGLFSLIHIPFRGLKRVRSYLPLLLFVIGFLIIVFLPELSLGVRFHFFANKDTFSKVDEISKKGNIYDFSDMQRYHKTLNSQTIYNDLKYNTQQQVYAAFATQIEREELDIRIIEELRKSLLLTNVASLYRNEEYLVLTVDGMIDNEYGFIRAYKGEIVLGQKIPPFQFKVIRLLSLGDGWYYYETT